MEEGKFQHKEAKRRSCENRQAVRRTLIAQSNTVWVTRVIFVIANKKNFRHAQIKTGVNWVGGNRAGQQTKPGILQENCKKFYTCFFTVMSTQQKHSK